MLAEMSNQQLSGVQRYRLLDQLRGLTFISMCLYHASWDLVYLFGVQWSWYTSWLGALWQQSIGWTFVLLSGFCMSLGRHWFQSGVTVLAGGAIVSLATLLVMPDSAVRFGVLTLLGSAMLLTGMIKPLLQRAPAWLGFAASMLLFSGSYWLAQGRLGWGAVALHVPSAFYANYATAYLGFPQESFCSADYYPLLPWIFLFWAGYYLYQGMGENAKKILCVSVCTPLGWVGRHTLLLYLLHQPVIYGILNIIHG
jgi:uncharacterized membrane protein